MKEYLSQKGIKYEAHDVAKDKFKRQEMLSKTGRMAVPTIIVGEDAVIGFNKSRLDKLLH